MTASLLERGVAPPAQLARADLRVRREDVEFETIEQTRLRISVTVANHGNAPSRPTIMSLQAAPLGAFVSWQDLTCVTVPSISPYESVEVTAEVGLPGPRVGDSSQLPPRRLLTAVGGDDKSPSRRTPARPLASALQNLLRSNAPPEQESSSSVDPFSLFSRRSVHWAGNINVLIGKHAVERHLARALRIYAGHANLAIFFVGDRPDKYRFELSGSGVAWKAQLFDLTHRSFSKQIPSGLKSVPQSKWIKMHGCRMVLLGIEPPECCEAGEINVHVRQRSTNREAVVEFSLDPSAAGPGCYTT